MSYKGYVVEIDNVRKHENADRLNIVNVFGNDVVTSKDVKEGTVMIYFPTDGQLSYDYAYKNNLLRKDKEGNPMGGYLDPEKRNVRAIKLRGENSDGILLGLGSLRDIISYETLTALEVGDKIDVLDGVEICKKYVPESKVSKEKVGKQNSSGTMSLKKRFPQFAEHIDTNQFAYNINDFKKGDIVTISLKVHGTSGRTSFALDQRADTLKEKILKFFKVEISKKYSVISGTRRTVLNSFEGGFYGDNEFRKKYHELFDGKLEKGETAYYEIVGWIDKSKTIMPSCDNKKLKDKNFVKTYGEKTTFSYGCEKGQSDIFVYRMTKTDEDGNVFEYPTWLAELRCEQMGIKHVPVLDRFIVTSQEDLMDKVDKYEDGHDLIDPRHIREGIILRIENRDKFKAYKQKNFAFKVLEGIIKDEAVEADIEEQDGV